MTPRRAPRAYRPFQRLLLLFIIGAFFPGHSYAGTNTSGSLLKVSDIRLEGREAFSNGALLDLMETKPPRWHFWRHDYQADVFEKDLKRITDYYHRHGYLQTEIEDKEIVLEKDGRSVRLTAWIFEGPLSRVKAVRWEGVNALSGKQFLKLVQLKAGDPLNQDLLNATLRSILKAYAQKGYLSAEVNPLLGWDADHHDAEIMLKIQEGSQARLGEFKITGLERSRDWVVRREFRIKRGEPLCWDKIESAQQSLYLTGIFQTLYVKPGPASKDGTGTRDLNVSVQENKGKQINLLGGWGSLDRFHGQVQYTDVNMLGRARNVSALASASNILQHIEGNYGTPWTAGVPWFNNVNLFGERQYQPGYDLQKVGGILSVGRRLSAVSKFQISYQHTNAYLSHVNVNPAPDADKDFVRSIQLSLILDHRDSFIDAKEGYYLSSSAEMSGAFFHGTNTFIRTIHQAKVYHKVTSSTVWGASVTIGWLGNYRSTTPIPLSELFYAGGPDVLRGFAYQHAGPLDSQGVPLGGQLEILLNAAEIRQHIWKFLGVVGFWDIGNVFENIDDFKLSRLRTTGGWGLRISSGLGILRADEGYIMNPRPGESRHRLSVSIGQAF